MDFFVALYQFLLATVLLGSLIAIKSTKDIAKKERKIKEELRQAEHIGFESFPPT